MALALGSCGSTLTLDELAIYTRTVCLVFARYASEWIHLYWVIDETTKAPLECILPLSPLTPLLWRG